MNMKWVDTRAIYHAVIDAPDNAVREQIYTEQLLSPWSQMMAMVAGPTPGESDDPFAGAKRWHWLLPTQLQTAPTALTKLETANAWELGCKQ